MARVEYTEEELSEAGFDPLPAKLSGKPTEAQKAARAPKPAPTSKDPQPEATAAPAPTMPPAKEERQLSRYEFIESELRRKETSGRLALALGYSGKDENGKSEAFKYISSVLQQIKKTECAPGERDSKLLAKDLTFCTSDSIVSAMIDAASFRLPIDGRNLAYLVKYGDKATFQPGYRGFLYKIAEHYKDVDFTAEIVFEGDELTLSDNGGFQSYTHVRKDPFQRDQNKMIGLITCLSYTDGAGRHSKIAALPKAEIDQIRRAAKQDYIWASWFFEKAKAAGLKRLCKIHFATIMGIQELAQYDNAAHFTLSTPEGDRLTPSNADDLHKKLSQISHQPVETITVPMPAAVTEVQPELVPVAAAQIEGKENER